MSNYTQDGLSVKTNQISKRSKKNNDYQSLNNDASLRFETQIKNSKKFNGNSRKKQISINHLLEFQLYRDLPEYHQQHQRERRNSGNNHARNRKPRLFLHGMRFINVNYKFVVDYRKSYKTQQLDPNVPVDTNDILRIIVPRGNACPICLSDDLVAPRMITSCGHILCLTCLLSLLESEVPVHKKQESKVIVEKYRDCPLCGSIIRKHDVKPVQVDNVDERFEVPKINDEVILTLMTRKADNILPLPHYLPSYSDNIDVFPWATQQEPNLSQYLRFFKGDLSYLLSMYEKEKQEILAAYEQDRELYQDDGQFVKLAISNIEEDIAKWSEKFDETEPQIPALKHVQNGSDSAATFYYYQTGFKASSTFVLSPLDMKVLKSCYNQDYTQLPSSVIAKVENIKYEELSADTATTKYKYLSHLPQGTTVGFLECNWQHNEYISPETWNVFRTDLEKRTKQSQKRLNLEEKNRRRALNEEEKRAREYIERENNGGSHESYYGQDEWMPYAAFGSLTISDHRDMPVLASGSNQAGENSGSTSELEKPTTEMQKTVWGTEVPKSELQNIYGEEVEDWDAEEMIRRAKEEIEKQGGQAGQGKKKKKKKIVLLSSGSAWS